MIETTWNKPNLQRPRTQNPRSFILGHVRGSGALVIRDLLRSVLLHYLTTAAVACARIAGDNRSFFCIYTMRV
jgi:hypothetical protein